MKFYFLFFFLLLFPFVSGASISPGTLSFLIELNNELCQVINYDFGLEADKLVVRDGWARDDEENWSVYFNASAQVHNITITYNNELSESAGELEVCITGEDYGEYRGVILIREDINETSGNLSTALQVGTWLLVEVADIPEPEPLVSTGSSSGGSGKKKTTTNSSLNDTTNEVIPLAAIDADKNTEVENLEAEGAGEINPEAEAVEDQNQEPSKDNNNTTLIIIGLVVLVIIGFIYMKKRR